MTESEFWCYINIAFDNSTVEKKVSINTSLDQKPWPIGMHARRAEPTPKHFSLQLAAQLEWEHQYSCSPAFSYLGLWRQNLWNKFCDTHLFLPTAPFPVSCYMKLHK
jgi:hypothetical protein